MSGRKIVIDLTIFEQINLGNTDVAKRLRDLLDQGAEVWTTRETYTRLLTQADRRLFSDLQLRSPMQDNYVERYESRQMLDGINLKSKTSGALAFHLNAEVMTMDAAFQEAYLKHGVVPGMSSMKRLANPNTSFNYDYNQARRILSLPRLNINGTGRILPTVATVPGTVAPATVVAPPVPAGSAQRPSGGGSTGPTTARVGGPVQPVKEHGLTPAPKTEAAATIGLQGVNWVIQAINDSIQKRKFDEVWTKLKPRIDAELAADPSKGVMIFVYYSRRTKVGAENDSPLEHVALFQAIAPAYGYTPDDALYNLGQVTVTRSAGEGEIISERNWFPPKKALDVRNLPAPFQAAGLAMFVPGRERLVHVKFSGVMGFDDKMTSVAELKVPAGVNPRFFYLYPPTEITYWDGQQKTTSIEIDLVHAAEVVDQELAIARVPVVELDSAANPGSAKAAMIYPADNATANLFEPIGRTQDNLGFLARYRNIKLMRWVKPQNMRLLQDFASTTNSTPDYGSRPSTSVSHLPPNPSPK